MASAAAPPPEDKRGLSQSMHNPHNDISSSEKARQFVSWPRHFIIRKGGTRNSLVPVIPIDLLPDYVEIIGLPKELTISETVGMSNLGEFPKPSSDLQLNFVSPAAQTRDSMLECIEAPAKAPNITTKPTADTGVRNPSKSSRAQDPPPIMPPPPPPRRVLDWAEDTESVSTDDFSGAENSSGSNSSYNKRRGVFTDKSTKSKEKSTAETAQRMLQVAAAASAHRLAPHLAHRSTSAPAVALSTDAVAKNNGSSTNGKKNTKSIKSKPARPAGSLCRHWCQTGQCSFGTDCRYTHQMPVTLEGLTDVGLTELPGWWRKSAGLPVEGTIDVRIFSAAGAAAATSISNGGKKSPGSASGGGSATSTVSQSKKTKMKNDKEERKMAEEVHSVRLGVERARANASPVPVSSESGKRKMANGNALQAKKAQQVQHQSPVEKLVDI
ncbi:zinc finger dna-binding protein [Colletotrichum kahawae]|uniref:Zinc finger dna-binding protein n=1 Tax=Colletotrichum kahawae TaxID=34407 RepID=A0AAD9Y9M0_COLKA|nr:zinc finger dna-binding protein [Colletotrichum kahawae]